MHRSTVCANILPDDLYGDIYENIEECVKEHPNEKIVVGYCLVPDDSRIVSPDWFWHMKSAIDYAMRNYGGFNHAPIKYPII